MVQFANPAFLAAALFIGAFFAVVGYATARDNAGPVPACVWIACPALLALSVYALVFRDHPWMLISSGVFAVVHLVTALLHRNDAQVAPVVIA